jgi:hypothetical protein
MGKQAAAGELQEKMTTELRKYYHVDTLSLAVLPDYWE